MKTEEETIFEKIEGGFYSGTEGLDQYRSLQLDESLRTHYAVTESYQREYKRSIEKYGKEHPRTFEIALRIDEAAVKLKSIEAERRRSTADTKKTTGVTGDKDKDKEGKEASDTPPPNPKKEEPDAKTNETTKADADAGVKGPDKKVPRPKDTK